MRYHKFYRAFLKIVVGYVKVGSTKPLNIIWNLKSQCNRTPTTRLKMICSVTYYSYLHNAKFVDFSCNL